MEKSYYSNISKIIISKDEIDKGITKAAKWIDDEYKLSKSGIVLIGILKGCIPFFGQLITKIEIDLEIDFMVVSSFQGSNKVSQLPEIKKDIDINIQNKDVLLVEDIIDSGNTIKYVVDKLNERKPKSIKIITLLNKKCQRKVPLEPNFSCFNIPNEFIVGFGLDYKEKYRNYEFIGILKKRITEIKGE